MQYDHVIFTPDIKPTEFDDKNDSHYVTSARLDHYDISPATAEHLACDAPSLTEIFAFRKITCNSAEIRIPIDQATGHSRFELAFLLLQAKSKTRNGNPYKRRDFIVSLVNKAFMQFKHRLVLPIAKIYYFLKIFPNKKSRQALKKWKFIGSQSPLYFQSRLDILKEFTRRSRKPDPTQPVHIKKVLVIYPDLIGDNITAAPMLAALKEHKSELELHYLTSPKGGLVYEYCPHLAKVWIWDSPNPNNHHGTVTEQSLHERERIMLALRQENFDACLLLSTWPDRAVFTSQLDIPISAVPDTMDMLFHATHKVPYWGKWIYTCHMQIAQKVFPDLPMELPEHQFWYGADLSVRATSKKSPRLAVQTWAPYTTRRTPIPHFMPLIKRYLEQGWDLVIFDQQCRLWEQQGIPIDRISYAGDLPLREAMELMGTCDAFIGNDGGMGHVASMHGLPVLVVFTTVEPQHWVPHTHTTICMAPDIQCAGCGRRTCNIGITCLDKIKAPLLQQETLLPNKKPN